MDDCAMSTPKNLDGMAPPSNTTPNGIGPIGGGVPEVGLTYRRRF